MIDIDINVVPRSRRVSTYLVFQTSTCNVTVILLKLNLLKCYRVEMIVVVPYCTITGWSQLLYFFI